MDHAVYDVYTDLDPVELGNLAAETFFVWLKFAMGQATLGGKKLKHPSGRYASAISWKRTGVASVAIIADEDAIPEVGAIEYGHPATSMKDHMLGGGNTHISKDGYMYRTIPLRPDQWRDKPPEFNRSMVVDTLSGGRLRKGLAKMWAQPRPWVDPKSRFRTMSDRPGSSPWIIPVFHPYAPGKILADILREEFGV